jgi:hypothetical protein
LRVCPALAEPCAWQYYLHLWMMCLGQEEMEGSLDDLANR